MSAVSSLFVIVIVMSVQCHISDARSQVRQRCDSPTFSCKFNNPCDPQCEEGQTSYPGPSNITYVQCAERECTEQRCPRRTTWNQESSRCENNGVEARCAFPTFNCADRNPCKSTLCEQDVNNYPGPGPKTYVSCDGGCSEEKCARRQVWDQDAQRCVRKPPPTPAPPTCTFHDLTISYRTSSPGSTEVTSLTYAQCRDGCLADSNCYGYERDLYTTNCYYHNEKSNLDTRNVLARRTLYVKDSHCV